jgi:hypothetical protein
LTGGCDSRLLFAFTLGGIATRLHFALRLLLNEGSPGERRGLNGG